MKKFIRFVFATGHIFEVPSDVVAADRINYIAVSDPGRERSQIAAETEMMFASDFAVVDWAKSNMDWADMQKHARLVAYSPPAFQTLYDDAEMVFADDAAKPDIYAMGEATILAPIELAMVQTAADGLNCMIMAFHQPGRDDITSAVAVIAGSAPVVHTYVDALSRVDAELAALQPAQEAPTH